MKDGPVEKDSVQRQSPRQGAIDLLQMFSLFLIPTAWLLPEGSFRISALSAAAVLGLLPFLLVRSARQPGRGPIVRWRRGFTITPLDRRELEEDGVPPEILRAIDAMIGVYYRKRKDLEETLFQALDQQTARPWLNKILSQAKHYGAPPPEAAPRQETTHQKPADAAAAGARRESAVKKVHVVADEGAEQMSASPG